MKRDLCTAEIEAWEMGEARHSRARVIEAQRKQEAAPTSFSTVLAVFITGLLIALPSLAWLVRYLVRS